MSEPLKRKEHTHCIFADESGYNTGRYRAVAAISATRSVADDLSALVQKYLSQQKIAELKWERVRSNHKRDSALWIYRHVFNQAIKGGLRVDVLGWDTHDSRHAVRGRDDLINLEKMYHHLGYNVMLRRWTLGALWNIYPDEHTALNWKTIEDTLRAKSTGPARLKSIPEPGTSHVRHVLASPRYYTVMGITPMNSRECPLVQVADLFAGLMVYSRNGTTAYDQWKDWRNAVSLGEDFNTPIPSASEKARSAIINMLGQWIRAEGALGFSIDRGRGLHTLNPNYPINFWWYRPQRVEDKAPSKSAQ